MKKGEIYDGVIDKVVFPNKGIIFVGEDTVTVKNGIPGQRIRFQINKKRKNRMEGASAGSAGEVPGGSAAALCAVSFRPAEAVCIRRWIMKHSWR